MRLLEGPCVGPRPAPGPGGPSREGRGLRDRQKKVSAHSRRRDASITPTEEGESGSFFI